MSAPPRPPAKLMSAWRWAESAGGTRSSASAAPFDPIESSMSLPERQMSIAVQPAANAPATAEKSDTAHAGVGWPMYVTQEKTRQKIQQQSVQKGYPGGCGTPRWSAAVASSPESSRPTEGPRVKK